MEQQLSLNQRHLLTPSFLTSLQVLTKPLPELAVWLESRIEENPLLSLDPAPVDFETDSESLEEEGDIYPNRQDYCKPRIIETTAIVEQRDLYTLLSSQAREAFADAAQLKEVLDLVQQIDKKGFLPSTVQDSFVLSVLQTFDPPGVGARSMQEALLLQLKRKNTNSILLQILQTHYNDLLHHRIAKLSKLFKIDQGALRSLIQRELAQLSLAPGDVCLTHSTIPWIPDLSILEENGQLKVDVNRAFLPRIFLNRHYVGQSSDEETRSYLLQKRKEATLLIEALRKRSNTLRKLGLFLIKTQSAFFLGKSARPYKLSIEQTALQLNLHGSTIGRAIEEKVIDTPFGMQPLESFFRHGQALPFEIEGKIAQLIQNEDKNDPLSDAAITEKLSQAGFSCSRRTVAKYRNTMHLPNAHLRKQ